MVVAHLTNYKDKHEIITLLIYKKKINWFTPFSFVVAIETMISQMHILQDSYGM